MVKTNGRWSKQWRKCTGGDKRTRCHCGDGLPPNHNSELCTEKKKMKIFKDHSDGKNMVFNLKKLLNVGMDLIPFHSSLVDCYATTYLVLHC
jgi:hypothetical protein